MRAEGCGLFAKVAEATFAKRERPPSGLPLHWMCSSQKSSSTRNPMSSGEATGNRAMPTGSKMAHSRFSGSSRRQGRSPGMPEPSVVFGMESPQGQCAPFRAVLCAANSVHTFLKVLKAPGQFVRALQRVEKASQSSPSTGGESSEIIFCRSP